MTRWTYGLWLCVLLFMGSSYLYAHQSYSLKTRLETRLETQKTYDTTLETRLKTQKTYDTTFSQKSDTTILQGSEVGTTILQGSEVVSDRTSREIIPVQQLSGENLKRMSVHSVADAIRYFSGVQIKDYGGIGGLKTVNIRSLGTHHTGVFYDGIQIGNAQNGVVDLGRFSLDNIEAVTLYNGQKSAIFQTAKDFASASSIYLQTRRPVFDDGKKYNLNIALKGGSFKTINPSLLWEHLISDKVSFSLSTEFLYTLGEYKFRYKVEDGYDVTDIRKNADVRSSRIEAAFMGELNQGSWNVKTYWYNSERGYPGAYVREEPGQFKHQDRQWDDNIFIQGQYKQGFGSCYSLMVNAKYAYDYLHYLSDPRLDVSTMYVDNSYHQQEVYLSHAHQFSIFPQWNISLANDIVFNTLEADLTNFARPRRWTVLSSAATAVHLSFMDLQASLLHTFVNDKCLSGDKAAKNKSILSPSVVISFKPISTEDFYINAFYKNIFRMPSLNDLYYTFIGNIELEPEKTIQYDLGLNYQKNFHNKWFKAIGIKVDGYFNQVRNKIIAMPTSNQFRWTMLNLGYVEIWGIDTGLQFDMQFGPVKFSPKLTYTWQQAQDKTDPKSDWYGGQIPYIPWHSASAIIGLSIKDWTLNYSFIYTGQRYESVANIPENYAQPWYTHDLSLSKTFHFKKFSFRATAEVNNIFNQQYEVVKCYPMPGTNFNLKINFIL